MTNQKKNIRTDELFSVKYPKMSSFSQVAEALTGLIYHRPSGENFSSAVRSFNFHLFFNAKLLPDHFFLTIISVSSHVFSVSSSCTPVILILLRRDWFSRYSCFHSKSSNPSFISLLILLIWA